tara:strand:- start:698 stop:1249 length:552 start_codon:yes stop_codon:yes gene_type:complete
MKIYLNLKQYSIMILFLLCSACSISNYSKEIPTIPNIGNFKLGHLVVKAENAQKGFFSRKASKQTLEKTLKEKLSKLLINQNGDHFFHISAIISGYVLAQPGIPVLLSPKSVLIIDVFIFDDQTQQKVFEKPRRFAIFESFSTDTIIGTGLTLTAEQQLDDLTTIAVNKIGNWLIDNKEIFEK